jgi:hypothetical protein
MPGDPAECRDHAKQCLQMAAEAQRTHDKEIFENLARTWIRLACELESSTALLKEWDSPINKKAS